MVMRALSEAHGNGFPNILVLLKSNIVKRALG